MELRLFDCDPASLPIWTQIATEGGHRLTACPSFDASTYTPSSTPGLTVIDRAAVVGNFSELMVRLAEAEPQQEFVATGAFLDVSDVAALMHQGVAYVLARPLDRRAVASVVEFTAIRVARSVELLEEFDRLSEQFSALTKREIDVLNHVLEGTSNRQSAEVLAVSVRTVESRRAKLYRKLGAQSVAEVIRKVERLAALTGQVKPLNSPLTELPAFAAYSKPDVPSVA